MGWQSPFVLSMLSGGVVLLGAFVWIETVVPDPMFRLNLFRIRMFTAGNLCGFLGSLARGSAGTLEELSGEVERCVLRTGVNRPVAALLVARARGVELPDLAREAEAELRRVPPPGPPPLSPSQTT
jgi:hypothetical protein